MIESLNPLPGSHRVRIKTKIQFYKRNIVFAGIFFGCTYLAMVRVYVNRTLRVSRAEFTRLASNKGTEAISMKGPETWEFSFSTALTLCRPPFWLLARLHVKGSLGRGACLEFLIRQPSHTWKIPDDPTQWQGARDTDGESRGPAGMPPAIRKAEGCGIARVAI